MKIMLIAFSVVAVILSVEGRYNLSICNDTQTDSILDFSDFCFTLPANINCMWKFELPDNQNAIQASYTGERYGRCGHDLLSIYDGPNDTYPLLFQTCGMRRLYFLRPSGNVFSVYYKTVTIETGGLHIYISGDTNAFYQAMPFISVDDVSAYKYPVSKNETFDGILRQPYGTINYNGDCLNDSRKKISRWIISGVNNGQLFITVERCYVASIFITDGHSRNSSVLCKNPDEFVRFLSETNSVKIESHDQDIKFSSFQLEFTERTCRPTSFKAEVKQSVTITKGLEVNPTKGCESFHYVTSALLIYTYVPHIYTPPVSCVWKVNTTNYMVFNIMLEPKGLYPMNMNCNLSRLRIYDGWSVGNTEIVDTCEPFANKQFMSSSNMILIKYDANLRDAYYFNLKIAALNCTNVPHTTGINTNRPTEYTDVTQSGQTTSSGTLIETTGNLIWILVLGSRVC